MSKLRLPKQAFGFLLIIGLFVLLFRWPYASVKFWTIDETGFAAVANKLCDGHILYKEACDNKPPFVFYFFAGVFTLFGKGNMYAVHMATLLFVFAGIYFLYRLSVEIFSEQTARTCTVAYTLFLVAAPPGDVFAANTESYLVPTILAGLCYCLMGLRNENAWRWLAAGASFGMACWIKQPGILFCAAVPIVAAVDAYPFTRISLCGALRRCVWALVGFCSVTFFWLALMWRTQSLHDFITMVILYNTKVQIASIPFRQSIRMAEYTALAYFKLYFAAIFLALTGLGLLIIQLARSKAAGAQNCTAKVSCRTAIILICWLAISVVAVSLGGRFYGFYMYMLAPIAAALAAVSLERFRKYWPALSSPFRLAFIIFLAVGLAVPFYELQKDYFSFAKQIFRKNTNPYDPDPTGLVSLPSSLVSHYSAKTTAEGDQIFVWGYQPCIYVLSGRDFATRYFSVALQTGFVWGTIQQISGWYSDYQFADPGLRSAAFDPSETAQWIFPGSQKLLLQDLQSNPPELFIDGNVPGEWPFGAKYPIARFPKFQEFLSKNYKFEKNIFGYRIYRRMKTHSQSPEIATTAGKVLSL